MNVLLFICWTTLILYILLETEAVPKWGKLLRLKFLAYDFFEEKRKMFEGLKYPTALRLRYPNFFVFLVTCEECLCAWLCILGFLAWGQGWGGWRFYAPVTLLAFIAIAAFKKLLKKLYE